MFTNFFTIAASFVGLWAFLNMSFLSKFVSMKIPTKHFMIISKDERQFVLTEEFASESRHPIQYSAFCFSKSIPWFYISHVERLLQAGWRSQDRVTTIFCHRWKYTKLKDFLRNGLKDATLITHGIPVRLLMPYEIDRIGSLKQKISEPVLNPGHLEGF
jgi:hypothetical protein